MPDSAPEEYKELAQHCCHADPDMRPNARTLAFIIESLIEKAEKNDSDDSIWDTIYHNDVRPLLRLEKENKYSSKLLPTGDLPKSRNSYVYSVAGMKTTIDYN